ncbi:MurR/RpiR family transcriptional regulator [Streptococcus thoraltensis]|uniref:MurR/RpiR family transcriptional regulator n=1 Tax=Streptococcus thoraltensis TaxID=55085 RepID=UPI00037549F8|nr:MurR/RpiR family transcriptional regulator [Streptococcus thoraltensis]
MANLTKNVIPLIESYLDSMTSTEQTIAQYFITGQEIKDLSAVSVCKRLHVSKASLTRFAQKCGFAGYREFVFSYQESQEDTDSASLILKRDVTKRVLADYDQLLQKTYSILDESQLARVTSLVENAKRIYLYGKGSSGQALREMKMRFMRLGLICDIVTDNDELLWASMLADETCLVIGASISGKTKAVIDALLQAKDRGAKTILLTTQKEAGQDSPWDELVLLASTDNLAYGNRISPQFPLLLVIDCLFAYYLEIDVQQKQERYQQTIIDKEEI